MASWSDVETAAPELAAGVKARFDAYKHKVMATLRKDGSPRVSGTEVEFRRGDLWFGSMPDSMKALDLERDPRVAIHSATADPEMVGGDAKLSGRATRITDSEEIATFVRELSESGEVPEGAFPLFRVDVTELVLTTVDEERGLLIVDSWTAERGARHVERK